MKFFTDVDNYIDSYKISRKQPMNMSSLFHNVEDKMGYNLEFINAKLSGIDSIDNIFDRLKKNDNILLKKIKRIKKHDNSIIQYLAELNNYQNKNFRQKKEDLHTEIFNKAPIDSLKRSKTKLLFNYKSYKALRDDLK